MTSDLNYENVVMEFASRGNTVRALDTFNLHVPENEFLVVVGPSGCGKSTLLHMTAGLTHPTQGRVLLGGSTITDPGPDKAIVFQSFSLFPWKSVRNNIDFGLRINGMPAEERKDSIERAINLIGLQGFEDHYP
ncbi:ATP-binding cassette domain-containing protein, partial [Herbaspirillum sp. HC18]